MSPGYEELSARRSEISRAMRDELDPAVLVPLELEAAQLEVEIAAHRRAAGNADRLQAEREAVRQAELAATAAEDLARRRREALAAVVRQAAAIIRLGHQLGRAWRRFGELRVQAGRLGLDDRDIGPLRSNLRVIVEEAQHQGEHPTGHACGDNWIADRLGLTVEEIEAPD